MVLFFGCSLVGSSQVNQTDANGLRQGPWKKEYPNGRLMYEGLFSDGKPVGEWSRYYEGGQVKAKIRYVENSDSAYAQLFDPHGRKMAEGAYLDEQRTGTWILYSENRKVAEETYRQGQKHGTSRTFYPTGELFEESEWQEGVQEGNYRAFFKNGNPYMQCKYQGGKRNGLCLSHFMNGRVEMEALYKEDLREGAWKFYDEDGNLLYTLHYRNNELLNPEVRDSIDNRQLQIMERSGRSIPDPEKFMQDPSLYMMQMQRRP